MPFATYNYDLDSPRTDCEDCVRTSYIRRMTVTVIDCGDLIHNDPCDLWNNNLCPNDSCYCNPFIYGDKIYLQFNLPITVTSIDGNPQTHTAWGTDYFAALIDGDGNVIPQFDTIESFTTEFGIGVTSPEGKPYVWMVIDTFLLENYNICYFNVTIADGTLDSEYIPIANQFYTEPYCCVRCDQGTILVRGTYNKSDPFGGYYADFNPGAFTGDQNGYIAQIRVYGNIEKILTLKIRLIRFQN